MNGNNNALDKAFELLLDEAAAKVNEELDDEIPDTGEEVTFSKEHEEKMKRFFARIRRKNAFRKFSKYALRAACIVAVLFVVSGTAIFSVDAWRIKFLNFVYEIGEKNTDYVFSDEDKSGENSYSDEELVLGYIPEDFELKGSENNRNFIILEFISGKQYFNVSVEEIGTSLSLDTEDGTVEDITINGLEGYYSSNPNINSAIWHDDMFVYTVLGNISKEEIVKIAENLKKQP